MLYSFFFFYSTDKKKAEWVETGSVRSVETWLLFFTPHSDRSPGAYSIDTIDTGIVPVFMHASQSKEAVRCCHLPVLTPLTHYS